MALSNWDTLAFGTDGKPCDGTLRGFDGQIAEIYKNWLYVHDEKMWNKDRGYNKPVIAEIESGEVSVANFHVSAIRGPQQSIFVYVDCVKYLDKGARKVRRMAGIGCYGYSDPTIIMAADLGLSLVGKNCMYGSSRKENGEEHYTLSIYDPSDENSLMQTYELPPFDKYKPKWVGVLDSTVKRFYAWLKKLSKYDKEFQSWVESLEEGKRFNQGDAYFVTKLGGTVLEAATPVGKSNKPVLEKALDENKTPHTS